MLHGLPSEAPWNQGYESTPDFHCAHADCPEAAWAPNDFKLCETCGKHYCADHIARLDDLYLCDECRVCAHCKKPAVAQCGMCADLVCTAHVHKCGFRAEDDDRQIARAAHIFGSFDGWRARQICEEESISGSVIAQGAELARLEKDEYRANCSYYGQPCYGSWPESSRRHQPISMLLGALSRGTARLIGREDRKPAASVEMESELERARR